MAVVEPTGSWNLALCRGGTRIRFSAGMVQPLSYLMLGRSSNDDLPPFLQTPNSNEESDRQRGRRHLQLHMPGNLGGEGDGDDGPAELGGSALLFHGATVARPRQKNQWNLEFC